LTDESKHVETVLDQFGLQNLRSRGHVYSGSGTRAACAVQRSSPYVTKIAAALPGCCMFATGIIVEASENRTCSLTKRFCPATYFKDPKNYLNCDSRKINLASEQL
jgi:hypothetical protein